MLCTEWQSLAVAMPGRLKSSNGTVSPAASVSFTLQRDEDSSKYTHRYIYIHIVCVILYTCVRTYRHATYIWYVITYYYMLSTCNSIGDSKRYNWHSDWHCACCTIIIYIQYYTIIYYVTWCYMMLHDVTWCYMMLHDVTWCYMMLHDVTWCYMMLHDVTWCYMMLHKLLN